MAFPQELIKQLKSRSEAARQQALRALAARSGLADYPELLVHLEELVAAPAADEMSEELEDIVLENPCASFYPRYGELLIRGHGRAVEIAHRWVEKLPVARDEIASTLRQLVEAEQTSPHIRFRCAMSLYWFTSDLSYLRPAAQAVQQADELQWWKSIRAEAAEALGSAKLIDVFDELLTELGSPSLSETVSVTTRNPDGSPPRGSR